MRLRTAILAAKAGTQTREAAIARIMSMLDDNAIIGEMSRLRAGDLPAHDDFVESEGLTRQEFDVVASDPTIRARIAELEKHGVIVTLHELSHAAMRRGHLLQMTLRT